MSRNNLVLLAALGLISLALLALPASQFPGQGETAGQPYTDLLQWAAEGRIESVLLKDGGLEGVTLDGRAFRAPIPQDPAIFPELRSRGVRISVIPSTPDHYADFLFSFGPVLLLVIAMIFLLRRSSSGQANPDSFGRSRARVLQDSSLPTVKFADAAGIDEAKAELEEIVHFLRDPRKFSRLGGRIPKGVLLVGPPGTGKTLLARAIAGEAGVPFFSLSGSDFVEMYVGVGASRVRDLFSEAKKKAPCLVFIDEIDAVGRHRGAGFGGGNDEREQTLNQLLVEMDGFEANEGIILVAATNRPDVLDAALLRPGRFDRQVIVPRPDVRGREKILRVHARKVPLHPDVDLNALARGTPGFSGADLANMVNEAALWTAREDRDCITMGDLNRAREKVTMGAERRSLVISEREKRITACHEAGHTLVSLCLAGTPPVQKVSIIPRGMALGVTQYLPEEELHNETRTGLEAAICALLGGRVAEELLLGDVTSGAASDLLRATSLARKMVCEWGMSRSLGVAAFGEGEESPFAPSSPRNFSEETARLIDGEIQSILEGAREQVRNLLQDHFDSLRRLTEALMERESLEGEEILQAAFGLCPV